MVKISRRQKKLPTYIPQKANELPFFLEKKPYQGATGKVYPIPYVDRLSNECVDKEYDMVTLSNEYIEVNLLPELGGKVHGARQLSNNYEFIYQNACIKPAMVGLAGPWVSGGIEFNCPQHHRPTTFAPAEPTIIENEDGSKTCWMGEIEPFQHMRSVVGITVYPGSSVVEAKCMICNRTDAPLPFMWWNNLAVRVHKDYKAIFPPDVQWGNDHDRRAVISFPVMKGVYKTARPFDYGDGTDVTWFSNVKLPTSVMVMRGQSDMDFLGGYDFAADAGTITVADHAYSVGKKMWTWGDGAFGNAWCANLTDNGDRYIELMTGVYTDNQPDFTYLMPGEVKTFDTVWYPISGIGIVKNATREAALAFDYNNNSLQVGCITTSARSNAKICVSIKDKLYAQEQCDISPECPVKFTFSLPENTEEKDVSVAVYADHGALLVEYKPGALCEKQRPQERTIPPKPAKVSSLEELYLHGAHLEQYKHHTYDPEDYYQEALRRDPCDLRCNLAMGKLSIEKGMFDKARDYLQKSISRLKMRNDNPADPEAIYHLGRLENLTGNDDAAYQCFADATWQYAWIAPGLYKMACIDIKRGDLATAQKHLQGVLESNPRFVAARTLLGYLRHDRKMLEEALAVSPQDTFARYALYLLGGELPSAYVLGRPQDVIDSALDFMNAGLFQEAARVLDTCIQPDQMVYYYYAYCTGNEPKHTDLAYCFPNRLEDIAVLKHFENEWQAQYLLGCIYYDRLHIDAAEEAWERGKSLNPTHAFTHRNLAQLRFDHRNQKNEAVEAMETAQKLAPQNARIIYELLQLYKNTGYTVQQRLKYLEQHQELVKQRDDCYLEQIVLLTQAEQFETAANLLVRKRFNIYEGGEGRLTRHHTWLWTLIGKRAFEEGDYAKAIDSFQKALVYPENYGEGRHYSAQEANVHYYAGCALQQLGKAEEAKAQWQIAVSQPSQITEITYFAALSYQRLGDNTTAKALFSAMKNAGEERCATADLYDYYGVGGRTPLPFELDPIPLNLSEGYMLIALGCLGLQDAQGAMCAIRQWQSVDPFDFKLFALRKLAVLPYT